MNDLCSDPRAIAFVGRSNSGKTTLVEKIISELTKRGYRVGSVKHHGHLGIEMDREGKDSWRHMQAGSTHTVLSSPDRLVSMEIREEEQGIHTILSKMESVEIIIVEGFRNTGIPYFELFREGNERDSDNILLEALPGRIALVTNRQDIKQNALLNNVEVFDLDDFEAITSRVETYIASAQK